MTEKYHLKIKWKNKEKTEAYEIILYDGGQPLAGFKSVVDARLVSNILNEQEEQIIELETRNKRQYNSLKEITDLILEKDWNGFEKIIKDWEESERLLQSEFKDGDSDDR